MTTLVIYTSKYGHTKQYAQWLAEDLNADICEGKRLRSEILKKYSTIVFGGGLYAGKSKAARLIVKHFEQIKDKKIGLFTCGLADVSNEANILHINKSLDRVLTSEIRSRIKIFHVRGGIDYPRLNFLHKAMMKMLHAGTSKKPDAEQTGEIKEFLATYGQKIDFSDKKMLEPIIQYCRC